MDRRRIECRLADVVRANRQTIAITVPVVGVVLVLAGEAGHVPEWLAFDPVLMVAAVTVMASPLIAGLAPIVDRRGGLALLGLVGFSWGIELVGVHTGWPYGDFAYQRDLGPMLFGDVPLALPIFFVPILVNGYLLGVLVLGRRADRLAVRFPLVVALVVGLDLVLDPGAVSLGFWAWEPPGAYYGVPLQNFLGWILSATVAVGLLQAGFDHEAIVARLQDCEFLLDDLVNFALFWGLVNLVSGNAIPVLLAGTLLAVLVRAPWFDVAGLTDAVQSVDR